MNKQKIFFSYSRVDGSEYALRLAVDLKKKGFNVWIDQQDIRAGLEWDREIEKALESCDCVLFLETEKSVASNNCLDEVYYALEKKKKVIPLIYVDSNTPFRINRLQHVDFTKDYDAGLAHLVKELEGTTTGFSYPPVQSEHPGEKHPPLKNKNLRTLLAVGCLALLITAVILLISRYNSPRSSETATAIASSDSLADKESEINTPSATPDSMLTSQKDGSNKTTIPIKKKAGDRHRSTAGTAPVSQKTMQPSNTSTQSNFDNLSANIAGDWTLIAVEPRAESQRGYLKIEAAGENKASFKTYMQFYYPESKASSYLTIFNAFAGCSSCTVNKEIKLNVEDIAVGSRTIKKLQEDQADGKKAGDVILDANSNKSIRGTVTLEFVDNNTAVIKVRQPQTITLAHEFMLEPFVYTFRFKKNE